jgi:hypothetical protein
VIGDVGGGLLLGGPRHASDEGVRIDGVTVAERRAATKVERPLCAAVVLRPLLGHAGRQLGCLVVDSHQPDEQLLGDEDALGLLRVVGIDGGRLHDSDPEHATLLAPGGPLLVLVWFVVAAARGEQKGER